MNIDSKISSLLSNHGKLSTNEDILNILSEFNFSQKFKIITIAGTNGKGTTVAMLEHLFAVNNKCFISHTSPHVFSFNERIRINKKPVADDILLELLERLKELTSEYKLSYYQVAFLCCCLLTQKQQVDFLILEVGLGGRLDASNLFDADMMAITNISLDHCEVLGNDVESIGLEKVGISRKNKPLFLGSKMPISVMEYAENIGAEIVSKSYGLEDNLFEDSYNIAMAIAENLILKRQISYIPRLEHIRASARCLELKVDEANNSYIVVDVAHNEASVKHLFNFIRQKYPDTKIEAIFSVLGNKDLSSIIDVAAKEVYIWHIVDLSRVDSRALSLDSIKTVFEDKNITKVEYYSKLVDVNYSKKNFVTLVFGSFVLAGEFLKEYEKDNK